MSMQGSLLADEPASHQWRPGENWFFALLPPASVAARVAAFAHDLRRTHGLKGKPFDLWQYHVSLQGLVPKPLPSESWLTAGKRAASMVRHAAFEVCFDRVMSLQPKGDEPSRAAFVLAGDGQGLAGVLTLRESLGLHMCAVKLSGVRLGKFTPHVTMLYDTAVVQAQPIEPVRWKAEEFVLIHRPGTGIPYEVHERWLLRS